MMKTIIQMGLSVVVMASGGLFSALQGKELSIATWRNDDFYVWKQFVFPAFDKIAPGVNFSYDSFEKNVRNEFFFRLENDPTTSIIACKPFRMMDDMAQAGHLIALDGKIDLSPYDETALDAWRASHDGQVYCMPFAAVGHAFLYNKEHFDQAGIDPPKTFDGLFAALEQLRNAGGASPYLMGLRSEWANVVLGHDLIGPAFWHGNAGIDQMITGQMDYTFAPFLETFETMAGLRPYMDKEARNIEQITNLRAFNKGKVSVMPHGSWDISLLTPDIRAKAGVMAPLRKSAEDPCYMTWHMDIGFGISSKFQDQELALRFLQFMQSQEAMDIFTTYLPGFFLLHDAAPVPKEPLAKTYREAIDSCEQTQRFSRMMTKHLTPSFTQTLVRISTQVFLGELTPQQASQHMHKFLNADQATTEK